MSNNKRAHSNKTMKNFWSVFEAEQQRKRNKRNTIPPENFTEEQEQHDD